MYVLEYLYVVTLLLRILSMPDTRFKTKRTGSAKAGPEYEILNHNVNPYDIWWPNPKLRYVEKVNGSSAGPGPLFSMQPQHSVTSSQEPDIW